MPARCRTTAQLDLITAPVAGRVRPYRCPWTRATSLADTAATDNRARAPPIPTGYLGRLGLIVDRLKMNFLPWLCVHDTRGRPIPHRSVAPSSITTMPTTIRRRTLSEQGSPPIYYHYPLASSQPTPFTAAAMYISSIYCPSNPAPPTHQPYPLLTNTPIPSATLLDQT